jgi:hypothetical protein
MLTVLLFIVFFSSLIGIYLTTTHIIIHSGKTKNSKVVRAEWLRVFLVAILIVVLFNMVAFAVHNQTEYDIHEETGTIAIVSNAENDNDPFTIERIVEKRNEGTYRFLTTSGETVEVDENDVQIIVATNSETPRIEYYEAFASEFTRKWLWQKDEYVKVYIPENYLMD